MVVIILVFKVIYRIINVVFWVVTPDVLPILTTLSYRVLSVHHGLVFGKIWVVILFIVLIFFLTIHLVIDILTTGPRWCFVVRIDENMDDTLANVEGAQGQLLKYLNSISSNRWLMMKIFFVLIFFLMVFLFFVA